jgi:hypothetical protein
VVLLTTHLTLVWIGKIGTELTLFIKYSLLITKEQQGLSMLLLNGNTQIMVNKMFKHKREESRKRVIIFDNGSRRVVDGSLYFSDTGTKPTEEIDLTDTTDQEFNTISANPHNDKFIKKVTDRIDKVKKERLK